MQVNDVYELGRLPLLKTALDKLKAGGHTTLCTIVSPQHSCLAPSGGESSQREGVISSIRDN
jgi:hypothetical protein